jgi:hypothetical protein
MDTANTPNPSGWQIKKEIELSQIITILVVAVSVSIYIGRIEQRVAILETQMEAKKESDANMRIALDKINEKLDRLIEKGQK